MCTVIVQVPETPSGPVRLLAVRDEDPARAWDAPGEWWPELPGLTGVRDRRAGGAWLATQDDKLSVILNRAEPGANPGFPTRAWPRSRGGIVLDAAQGSEPGANPETAPFNLVTVEGSTVTVIRWDGSALARETLDPGVHMLAHDDVDDPDTARIAAWLPRFRELTHAAPERWRDEWISLLATSAQLPIDDDRAIIRDNTAHGFPTASLLVCVAEITADPAGPAVSLESATLGRPAQWDNPEFVSAPLV
ncbi:NRDE family protein [Leucobacter chinensis]|uniref:NRDE family protein n=1 Tax=Leucobacter chinensis TaxID=2851010 RepID=UPI001C21087B|nr:NRDE family protein [Leucobacter chinensis]